MWWDDPLAGDRRPDRTAADGRPRRRSLIIVNAADLDGYVIFESHGFKDENIADRMHIVIRRRESPRWFSYWVARFDAMWETAKPGTAASDELARASDR